MNKKIIDFVSNHPDIELVSVTYRFNGIPLKRKGFDFVNKNTKNVVARFEPLNRVGAGWMVVCRFKDAENNSVVYPNRIHNSFLNELNLDYISNFKI